MKFLYKRSDSYMLSNSYKKKIESNTDRRKMKYM